MRIGPFYVRITLPGIEVHKQPVTWFCESCHREFRWLPLEGRCDRCGGGTRRVGS